MNAKYLAQFLTYTSCPEVIPIILFVLNQVHMVAGG